jgi:hypothetical protein
MPLSIMTGQDHDRESPNPCEDFDHIVQERERVRQVEERKGEKERWC